MAGKKLPCHLPQQLKGSQSNCLIGGNICPVNIFPAYLTIWQI
jgi:hypothetical protein